MSPLLGLDRRGLEDITLGPFEQPRIDPLADDVEHRRILFFHDYALTELTVYGHGKADGLSFAKRKIEPALENTVQVVAGSWSVVVTARLAATLTSIVSSSIRRGTYLRSRPP